MISTIFKNILLKLEYKIDESSFQTIPSKLILISSHTSLYDFIIGAFIYYAYLRTNYDIYIFMKKDFEMLCTPLFSVLDKRFKLIPVHNIKNFKNTQLGLTEKVSNMLMNKDNYIIFIAPEGTRKCTNDIKSGYWNIAKLLDIHVAFLGVDFSSKNIILDYPRKIDSNWESEKDIFIRDCKKYVPLYPERCFWTKDYYVSDSSSS
jgi:1-acyl-sn-glycerol-3-phosphate acyltransferase